MSRQALTFPNPATDPIRRFTVVAVEKEPERGRAWICEWRIKDRTGFLPDAIVPVPMPARGKRPGDDAIAAAKARAERRRRDLNFCEAFGHLFDVVSERCATCGVRP